MFLRRWQEPEWNLNRMMILFKVLKKHLFETDQFYFWNSLLSFATQAFHQENISASCHIFPMLDTAGLIQILKTTQAGSNVYCFLV